MDEPGRRPAPRRPTTGLGGLSRVGGLNGGGRLNGLRRLVEGSDASAPPRSGFIDYRLARRALVREVTRGVVPVTDVCDAHPELLRAARNIGQTTARTCPICRLADDRADVPLDETDTLRLVTYAFGEELRRSSGHVVWTAAELAELASRHRFTAYVVECCLVCGWNHLVESFLAGRADTG